MAARHRDVVERLRHAVLEGPGVLSRATRGAIAAGEPPDDLAGYVDKIERHAYRITDADVERLKTGGRSDDELFEATISAALGAGLRRLDAGLGALR